MRRAWTVSGAVVALVAVTACWGKPWVPYDDQPETSASTAATTPPGDDSTSSIGPAEPSTAAPQPSRVAPKPSRPAADGVVSVVTEGHGSIDGRKPERYGNGLVVTIIEVTVADQVAHVPDLPGPGYVLAGPVVRITNRTGAPFDARGVVVTMRSLPNRSVRHDYFENRTFKGVIPDGESATGRPSFKVALTELPQVIIEVRPAAGLYEAAAFSGAVVHG